MYDERPGCLTGLLRIVLLVWVYDWLQEHFGWGRGCSCTGLGCGLIFFLIFLALLCSMLFGTDWTRLGGLLGLGVG